MAEQEAHGQIEPPQALLTVLTSVFEDTLKREHVGADDDFFDLGGDSLAAAALMMALDAVGVQLPVSVLFEAPTPAGLASVIESGGCLHEAPLVTLKQGDIRQPVFIAPGAGGSVLEMVPFARRIETPRQVYGLQPRDSQGGTLPLATIEQAAQYYLPLIRASQPHGPYILAGYSMGGMVAVELAHTLLAAGEKVELLILLDTLTPIEHFSFGGKIHFWCRRAVHHARVASGLPWPQLFPYALRRAQALTQDFRERASVSGGSAAVRYRNDSSEMASMPALSQAGIMFVTYRPKAFPGPVVFIKAGNGHGKIHYPDILWKRLARSLIIYEVEGDHETMLLKYPHGVSAAFSMALSHTQDG